MATISPLASFYTPIRKKMIMWDSEMGKSTVGHSKLRYFRNYGVRVVNAESLAVLESQYRGWSRDKAESLCASRASSHWPL